jgi:phosphoribosylamine--glycine ligase
MKAAKMCGIRVPKWKQFTDFGKAKKHVQANSQVWVFKPLGNKNPEYTYVADSGDDMLDMLDYYAANWKGPVNFILQERIEGVELSTEAFYLNGAIQEHTLNCTIECKKFMPGDIGPNTGCMGSVVRFWKKADPKIYRFTLRKFESFLKRFKYTGPLDINCIVSKNDRMPYFLEWTARFGYSAIYAACEGLTSLGGYIDTLLGKKGDSGASWGPSYNWLGAVRVTIPPYPSDKGVANSAGRPITGNDDHTWLLDAKYDQGRLVSAGVDGVVAEVTGKAAGLPALGKEIYSRIDAITIPDMQYRTDIITTAEKRIKTLQEWKYL